MSLDNFVAEPSLQPAELAATLGLTSLPADYALVLFHPDPSEREVAAAYLRDIIEATIGAGLTACIGYPNTDPASRELIEMIECYSKRPEVLSYRNLPRRAFISLYRRARFIVGNSSSGIIEAASIPLPAINVGLRQRGRLAAANVVFCDGDRLSIAQAIARVLEKGFQESLKQMQNPYGDGQAAARALYFLRNIDFPAIRLKTEDPLRQVKTRPDSWSAASTVGWSDSFCGDMT
jgi:UDP-N-acetylglucosamine 2-epimerase